MRFWINCPYYNRKQLSIFFLSLKSTNRVVKIRLFQYKKKNNEIFKEERSRKCLKQKNGQILADIYNILSTMTAEDYRTLIERVKLLCISNENCPWQKAYKLC